MFGEEKKLPNYFVSSSDITPMEHIQIQAAEIQDLKQLVIDKLDHLEEFRTYVQTENGYKVTTPEGYVLHKDGSMIKFVNRFEFAFNNFTLQKQWR